MRDAQRTMNLLIFVCVVLFLLWVDKFFQLCLLRIPLIIVLKPVESIWMNNSCNRKPSYVTSPAPTSPTCVDLKVKVSLVCNIRPGFHWCLNRRPNPSSHSDIKQIFQFSILYNNANNTYSLIRRPLQSNLRQLILLLLQQADLFAFMGLFLYYIIYFGPFLTPSVMHHHNLAYPPLPPRM